MKNENALFQTRERNRLRLDRQVTLDDAVYTVHNNLMSGDRVHDDDMDAWQRCVDANCWVALGDRFTSMARALIEHGVLHRPVRSYSGRTLESLYLVSSEFKR